MRRLLLVLALMTLALAFGISPAMAQDEGSAPIVHTVAPGENLFRIALRYDVTIQSIQQANNIANANLIFVGQQLTIPGTSGGDPGTGDPGTGDPGTGDPGGEVPSVYVVQRGDTLGQIARRFGTTVQAIASANGIANPNLIFVGQQLTIPGGTGPVDGGPGDPPSGGDDPVVDPGGPISGNFALGGHVQGFGENTATIMRNTGMTWVKKQLRWSQGEGTQGAQDLINQANAQNFNILLGIVGDPGQYAANPSQYIQDYANFVGQVATLGVDGIEVWNEPNIDREWPRGQISGSAYTQMLSASYNAIKSANPNVLVISGAPAPTGAESLFPGSVVNDDNFLRQMAAAGAANFMDCVGVHYNEGIVSPTRRSGDPRENGGYYTRYYPAMVDVYSGIFPGKSLCFTEIGYLTGDGYGPLPPGFNWADGVTIQNQAEWLAQAVTLARRDNRIQLMIIWNVNFTVYNDDPQAGYAIFRPDGTCPACNTIASAMQ